MSKFSEGFASWRSILVSVQPGDRPHIFGNACHDVATWIAKGLDRIAAIDELTSIALSVELDPDQAQKIVAREFEQVARDGGQGRVDEDDFDQPETNGQAQKRLLSYAEFLRGFMAPDYLIDRILQRHFLYALTAQTGHAKTAMALLIAELVASEGTTYFGTHRVEPGRVIYMIGENADDVRMRCMGSTNAPVNLHWLVGVEDLDGMVERLEIEVRALGGVDLIIVDTSAAYFFGEDENQNKQMGDHARRLRRLTLLPGAPCVLVLCHPAKYVTDPSMLLPRGGGAFLAEVDGNLTGTKRNDVVELHYNKIRGPGFEAMTFKLETVWPDNLRDAHGRPLPTVRAVAITQAEEDQKRDQADDDDDRMLIARLNVGDEAKLSVADFARRWEWLSEKGEPQKSRAHNALKRNVENKLMRPERGQYVLTEKGKDAARKAVMRMEREHAAAASQKGFEFVH